MQNLWQDLRYGARMLWKSPGFTLVAVLSLALGIGANTALFSLTDAVLLRLLPVREPERLVLFEWRAGRNFRTGGMRGSAIPTEPGTRGASMFRPDILDKLREEQTRNADSPLATLFAFAPLYELTAVYQQRAEPVQVQGVSGNYYAGLGTNALLGRTLTESDDQPSAAPAVVLSHHYWEKNFGANTAVIGQSLVLNQQPFTIVGVTPPGFAGTLQIDRRVDVTVPLAFEPPLKGENSAAAKPDRPPLWWVNVMGRLKPGATREQAQASLNGLFQGLALDAIPAPRSGKDVAREKLTAQEYPRLLARAGGQGLMETRTMTARTIYILFAVVALVLLIACANVANLLLSRAALRGPEISLRLAVGAGRWRLMRQLLTESVLLACLGGAVGVLFAFWGNAALKALTSRFADFLPTDLELSINGRALAFTCGVALLTGIVFGLAPAWRATGVNLNDALKQSKRSIATVSRLSKSLIVLQVALSLVLLVGAGLFIRTLRNLQQVNAGFNQENLLLFDLSPSQAGYKDERLLQFYENLNARLDALPGVSAATFATVPLLAYNMWNTRILLPGETESSNSENLANLEKVRENYFTTMEIPLQRGRIFTAQDDARAPAVGIVNQAFVRKYFPDKEVLGQRITDTNDKRPLEIVGVVADTKYASQRGDIEPLLYTPWRQEAQNIGGVSFALRTVGEPTVLAASVREAVRAIDANLPVTEIRTQRAQSEAILGQERLYARLLSFFGLLALLLAAIGLSGVLAYAVAQRTQEIGIRMALGAQTRDVLRLVIGQGMRLVVLGVVLGGAAGYGLKRWITSDRHDARSWQHQLVDSLYRVEFTDPWTFGLIASLLLAVAMLACWIPARRAASVDPMIALRTE